MTEQEIVNVLKENKTKGIAYMFMPKEVRNWISENYNNPKLLYFTQKAEWKSFDKIDDDYDNVVVFALPDDYKVKQEPKGEWEEFEITDNAFICSDKKEHDRWHFFWWDWQAFLTESDNSGLGYTAFGGWKYEGCNTWFMTPRLDVKSPNATIYQDSFNVDNYAECDCEPAIPIKIRFWRGINE